MLPFLRAQTRVVGRRRDKGFSLIELTVTIAIVATLAAVAVPVTLTQRSSGVQNTQKGDLTAIAASLDRAISGWDGVPPAQVTITSTGETWKATPASNPVAATGTISPGSTITGTAWTDGSYCLVSVNPLGATLRLRSDTGAVEATTTACPAAAFGVEGAAPTVKSSPGLPGAPTGLIVTNKVASVQVSWAAASGADSYLVKVPGATPQVTDSTTLTATITGLPVGSGKVTVYAKNANGTGPGTPAAIDVLPAPVAVVTPGQASDNVVWTALKLLNGWEDYNANHDTNIFPSPEVAKSGNIVQVRGLVNDGIQTADTVIAVLPAGFRPSYRTIFVVAGTGNVQATVDVLANGEIRVRNSPGPKGGMFLSLDQIIFPVAGTPWVTVAPTAYVNGWASYSNTSTYGPVRYWQDPDGLVWLGGLIANVTPPTSDSQVFTMPSTTLNGWTTQALVSAGAGGTGGMLVNTGGGVSIKGNTFTNTGWVSLGGVFYGTQLSQTQLNWQFSKLANGWVKAGWGGQLGYAQTSYGLVVFQGTGQNATASDGTYKPAYFLPWVMRLKATSVRVALCTGGNIGALRPAYDGGLQVREFTSWIQMDGVGYFPG